MVEETKRCPFCGEEILAIAKKCKHCQSDLSKKEKLSYVEQKAKRDMQAKTLATWTVMLFIVGIAVIYFFSDRSDTSPAPNKSATSDIDKLSQFHRQLAAEEKAFNDKNKANTTQIQASIQSGDVFALYNAASQLHDIAYAEWKRIDIDNAVTVPDFSNAEANKQVHEAIDAWKENVTTIQVEAENLMKAANGELTPETAHNIQAALQYSNQLAVNEAIALAKAYTALGYDLSQVDAEHGGLLASKQHGTSGQLDGGSSLTDFIYNQRQGTAPAGPQ